MSNKANTPKGYTERSLAELRNDCQQLLFALGQAHYNEEFAMREQTRIQDLLEDMEDKLRYAERAENAKQVEANNAKVREENKSKIEATPVGETPNPA